MAYPDDGDPIKDQILDQLVTTLGAIATPSYHFTVKTVRIFRGHEMSLGTATPALAIVPTTDERLRDLACLKTERQMQVNVYCATRVSSNRSDWNTEVQWLISDVVTAIRADIQLNGLAVYCDVEEEELPSIIDKGIAVGRVGLSIVYRHLFANPSTAS